MAAAWECPLCGERVPLEGITATPVQHPALPWLRVVKVHVPETALADAFTHTWTEHPEAMCEAPEEPAP